MNKINKMNEKQNLFRINKKGANIATGLLFIVAIVLIVITLAYFYGFSNNIGGKFNGFGYVSNEAVFAEDYIGAKSALIAKETAGADSSEVKDILDLKGSFSEIATNKDIKYMGAGNFFLKVRNGDFKFDKINCSNKIIYLLEIKGVSYVIRKLDDLGDGRQNENSWARTFDICNVFDEDGGMTDRNCERAEVLSGCGIKQNG